MNLRNILLALLLIGGGTIVLYWQQERLPFQLPTLPSLPHWSASLPQINQLSQHQQLQSITDQAQNQLQATSQQFQTVTGNVQKVLGAAVQVNDNETKSAPEKALDYGKYLYCKQVVNEFEKQAKSPRPTSSPSPE